MKSWVVLFSILSGLHGCNPDKIDIQRDNNGIITQLPHVWKSSRSDGGLALGMYRGYFIGEKGLLCVATRKSADPAGEFYLQLKDVNSGENIWIWDDFFEKKLARPLNRSIVVHENKLILHDLWADYCIDAQTGSTVWKRIRGFGSASELTNINDKYFITGLSKESKDAKKIDDAIFIGDFKSGQVEQLVKPDYSAEYPFFNGQSTYIGSIYRFKTFTKDGNDLLLIPYDEIGPEVKYNNNRSFFGLYNISQRAWIYNRKPLSLEEDGSSPSLMPIIHDDKVFLTSLNSLGCFELPTGKRIWQYRLTEVHTSFRDMLLVDGKMVISSLDGNLYCVDAKNGTQLWASPSGAFSSDIYHQDGVLYGINGDFLRACELKTGQVLWELKSLDGKLDGRDDSEFEGFVTGLPGANGKKGRIFATTNLNIYCFEAAR
ncbi:PQQ-binding-like beta-propeller repeat protein [Dyadobacter sp. CY343]|uniref:outer membrane protein assembly factor BamB family protein n=1 Tax=Dyadobacter sp. CY343 TaxID=2907299 RepID=UPI001F2B36F1|nr:PQQ-binding-like beta-propeller repeat protein [Dyadobacter sp. CY343]MCE7062373.1 PQQ-binding-like beta-propeller repeat protein [Dyadobacter sp. CY343]